MALTFENVYLQVLQHVPLATPFLARLWVQNTWNQICEFDRWSWLRAEAELLTNIQKSGTVSVTRSSATVTGVTAGLFASTDAGRQFKINQGPPYTIESVNVGANTCVLDRVYGDETDTDPTAYILDAYVTMPEDFGSFIAVIDPANSWRLRFWITEQELNRWDPARTSTGSPWCLVSRRIATATPYAHRPQYELWPYVTTAKRFPYYYFKRPAQLSDDDTFDGPLRNRTDIILEGALAIAAEWPGPSAEKRNPYYDLKLSMFKRNHFNEHLQYLAKVDQELFMTWLDTSDLINLPYAPLDAKFMQNHDFPSWPAYSASINVAHY